MRECLALIHEACVEIGETTNLDFDLGRISIRALQNAAGDTNLQGQIFYSGLRRSSHERIKLDISLNEQLVGGVEERMLLHAYDDAAEVTSVVPCYSLNEIFAEKMRALLQRNRARDLYDVWWLLGHRGDQLNPQATMAIFSVKASGRGIPIDSLSELVSAEKLASLEDHWDAQIGHQLPAAPMLGDVSAAIQELLIDFIASGTPGPTVQTALRRAATGALPTFAGPRATIVRAARERRVLQLRYNGTWRHVAPYEFLFGRQGDEQLFGFEYEDGHVKRFRVHRIEGLRLTDERFVPQYPVLIG